MDFGVQSWVQRVRVPAPASYGGSSIEAAGFAPFGAWTEARAGNNNKAILWQGSLKF